MKEAHQVAYDLGMSYETHYRSCAQCTIAAIQDALGVLDGGVFRSASSLGGGIGKLCDGSCGGYTGGSMMIGFFWGRTREGFGGESSNRRAADELTVLLHGKFFEEFGTVTCREIHDELFGRRFNLWDEADRSSFENAGAHQDKCTRVVALAASWATELIVQRLAAEGRSLECWARR